MRTMAAQRCAHASAAAISPSIAPKDHKGSRSAPGQPFTGAFLSSGHHPLSNPSPASRPPALRALGGSPGSLAASNDDDDLLQEADLAERFPAYNPRVIAALGQLDSSQVNYELICQLVQWIMAKGTVEAVQQSVGGSTSYFPHQQQQSGGPPGAADAAFNDDDGAGPGQRGQQRNGPRGQPVRGGDGSLDSILIFLSGQKARGTRAASDSAVLAFRLTCISPCELILTLRDYFPSLVYLNHRDAIVITGDHDRLRDAHAESATVHRASAQLGAPAPRQYDFGGAAKGVRPPAARRSQGESRR